MPLLVLFLAKHAVAIWLWFIGVAAFVADLVTGHI